jgi:general secretion pathway protein L
MRLLRTIGEIFTRWTDTVAAGIVGVLGRVVSPRVVRLVEEQPDIFSLQGLGKGGDAGRRSAKGADAGRPVVFAGGRFCGGSGGAAAGLAPSVKGSRVELVLLPSRFLLRPLELPARATDFIEGIVRAQIDRLTPWGTGEAIFGCGPPVAAGSDRIVTTIAATTRATASPFIAALSALLPASISIFTATGGDKPELIRVFEQQTRGLLDRARVSHLLRLALSTAAAAAVLATVAGTLVGQYLDGRRAELAGEVAARRAALRVDGGDRSPTAALAHRKNETQASVIVIDELARILPDHTYVTELHIEGSKLQVVGVTKDAPSLIRLIEQSEHFSRATFFAPTTRSPADPGERFHIEAKLEPINTVTR